MSLSATVAGVLAGLVAVAVLISGLLVKLGANTTGAVNMSEFAAPAAIETPVVPRLVWPAVPVTVPQFAVPAATQETLAVSVTPGGNASETIVFEASDGPAFVTTIVYVAVPPGV